MSFSESTVSGIHRVKMKSSLLAEACYDASIEVLDVTYVDGKAYRHYGVPPGVWQRLGASGAPGRYFLDEVRERYRRVAMPKPRVDE